MLRHGVQKLYCATTRAKHCFLKPAKLANPQTFLYTCNHKYSQTNRLAWQNPFNLKLNKADLRGRRSTYMWRTADLAEECLRVGLCGEMNRFLNLPPAQLFHWHRSFKGLLIGKVIHYRLGMIGMWILARLLYW